MTLAYRSFGQATDPAVIFVAGFGDNSSMFEPLINTEYASSHRLLLVDLPGTGDAAPIAEPLTLSRCGELLADLVETYDATALVAHSVASIAAALTAKHMDTPLKTIISLEGNLTPADAYYSGSAAGYSTPELFHQALLERLAALAVDDVVMSRYQSQVAAADAESIWHLGRDTRAYSLSQSPGSELASAAEAVHYVYNPDNVPQESLDWLDDHPMDRSILPGASHWPSIDQPDQLAQLLESLT